MTLKFFKLHDVVPDPVFATKDSACFDLAYCPANKSSYSGYNRVSKPFTRNVEPKSGSLYFAPGDRIMVPTGLILDIPRGFSVRIHSRSGQALKLGLVLSNQEGIIDSDYVEELFLLVHNASDIGITIGPGDRIAQGELVPVPQYKLEETKEKPVQKTDRNGGMGSTGTKQKPIKIKLPEEEASS